MSEVISSFKSLRDYVGSVYGGGYGGLSESGELCPVSFFVVGESPSVLL